MRRPSRQITLTLLTALAVLVAVPVAPATAAPERAAGREAKLQRAVAWVRLHKLDDHRS